MQRIRAVRWRRIIYFIIPIIVLVACVLLDQFSKIYFKDLYLANGDTVVIENFFSFTYLVNKGAAWGVLSNVSWGITFFIILTSVSLVAFVGVFIYALVTKRTFLSYSIAIVIGGTIGNFIDRVFFSGVTDFLKFTFGEYNFPVFNLADSFLVIGVILVAIYFLFIDKNAVFKRKVATEEELKTEDERE